MRDGARTLPATLESLRTQTDPDFDVVIVDDGSTDSTPCLLTRIAAEDRRFRIVRPGAVGRAAALRIACEEATGEVLLVVDADDPAHPNRVALERQAMADHPEFAVIAGRTVAVRGDDLPDFVSELDRAGVVSETTRALATSNPIAHSACALRATDVRSVGGYNAQRSINLDYDLWVRLVEGGHRIGSLDAVVSAKRLHDGQSFERRSRRAAYAVDSARIQRRAIAATGAPPRFHAMAVARLIYHLVRPRSFTISGWRMRREQAADRRHCRDGEPAILVVATLVSTIDTFLIPAIDEMRKRGWTVGAAGQGASAMRHRAAVDKVHDIGLSRSPIDLPGLVRGARGLRRALRDGAYEAVFVHTPIPAFLLRALSAARLLGSPRPVVVYMAHGFHFVRNQSVATNLLYRTLERMWSSHTDALIVINDEDFQAARRWLRAGDVARIAGVGLPADAYASADAERTAVRQELGVADDQTLVLCIGEICKRKCQADLVRALALLPSQDHVLVLAGDGPARPMVEKLATDLGVTSRVHFLGHRSDIPELLGAADLGAFVSRREGLARSVMEAMAAGVPVIGTDARGIADLIGDGAGVVVPVGDPEAIAGAIVRLTSDPALRARVVDVASARVRTMDENRLALEQADIVAQAIRRAGRS